MPDVKPRYTRTPGRHPGGPFRPGNTVAVGHDGGSKNNRRLTQTLIAALNESDTKRYPKGKIWALVDRLLKLAIDDGDLDAIKYVFDRVDGKVASTLQLEGADKDNDEPIEFTLRLGPVRSPFEQTTSRDDDGDQTNTH